jgi:hypothetical protein
MSALRGDLERRMWRWSGGVVGRREEWVSKTVGTRALFFLLRALEWAQENRHARQK